MAHDTVGPGAPASAPAAGPAVRRQECGVCWTPYDPEAGDPFALVPAGTPFDALPEDWVCPHCEAPKHKFIVARDD
jgi:rubredoxin